MTLENHLQVRKTLGAGTISRTRTSTIGWRRASFAVAVKTDPAKALGMRFRPAPLSFWANVITVAMFVPLLVFLWMGFVHSFPLSIVFFALAAVWALLLFFCWGIATREYRVERNILTIQPHVGASKTYELIAVDEIAMKRQPLRRAFAFRALGTYGPFGFHGRYRASITRPVEGSAGRGIRRLEEFQVACTTLQQAIYLQTKTGAVVVTPRELADMLQELRVIGER